MRKHLQYLSYVLRHKWFVFQAGRVTGVSLWRLLKHDWSKFLPSEWFAYVEYFYGERARLKREVADDYQFWMAAYGFDCAFDRAWLLHQHRNDHHWQHWVLREDSGATKILTMPDSAVREMVADWMGAGRAITGKWEASEWYARQGKAIQLSASTRVAVEAHLANAKRKGMA